MRANANVALLNVQIQLLANNKCQCGVHNLFLLPPSGQKGYYMIYSDLSFLISSKQQYLLSLLILLIQQFYNSFKCVFVYSLNCLSRVFLPFIPTRTHVKHTCAHMVWHDVAQFLF